jgi:hypothetical protein
MTAAPRVPRRWSGPGVPVIVHPRGESLNSSTPSSGRSFCSVARVTYARRSTSPPSALPSAAMIIPWSSER